MNRCQVYKTKKEYKFVTHCESVEGLYIASEPIFILGVNASIPDIKDAVFKCLRAKRPTFEAPLGEAEYKMFISSINNKLKEKSIDLLGKKSKSYTVVVQNKILTLYLNKWVERTGLTWDGEHKFDFELEEEDLIASKVVELLN